MNKEIRMHPDVFHSILESHRRRAEKLERENWYLRRALKPFVALQPFRGYKAEENHLREVFVFTDDLEYADRVLIPRDDFLD